LFFIKQEIDEAEGTIGTIVSVNEKHNPLTPKTRKKYQRHIKSLKMSLKGCDDTPRNK
jgi:hypothetical protein